MLIFHLEIKNCNKIINKYPTFFSKIINRRVKFFCLFSIIIYTHKLFFK